MKHLILILILFISLSCKKEIDPTPFLTGITTASLVNTDWILISSGAYPTCCNGISKFELKKTDWTKTILTYNFSVDRISQKHTCFTCNDKSTQVANAQ
jgi:hypothetical protein